MFFILPDPRGHYLILPALDDEVGGWRDQSLLPDDCLDVTYLASTADPPGSVVLSYNSVGAGASQNHIHCHAWVCPPPPLSAAAAARRNDEGDAAAGGLPNGCYAATRAEAVSHIDLAGGTRVSLLDYPCTCIRLSASGIPTSDGAATPRHPCPVLREVGEALSRIVGMAREMRAPHNVAWTTGPSPGDRDARPGAGPSKAAAMAVDVYVFVRAAETTFRTGGAFRLGSSEMMGVFHSSSEEELESLSSVGVMGGILSDVSWEPRESVWRDVRAALETM